MRLFCTPFWKSSRSFDTTCKLHMYKAPAESRKLKNSSKTMGPRTTGNTFFNMWGVSARRILIIYFCTKLSDATTGKVYTLGSGSLKTHAVGEAR